MTVLVCLSLAAGLALVWAWVDARRYSLARRIEPRLRLTSRIVDAPDSLVRRLAAPLVADVAALARRWGRPAEDIERRLARAGSTASVARHRLHGVVAGGAGLGAGLALGLALAAWRGGGPVAAVLVAVAGAAAGAVAPDALLVRRAAARAAQLRAELPAAAEMLALAVVAGEAVPAALERVARLSGGALGDELGGAVRDMRAGGSVATALDGLATRVDEPMVTAFADAVVTAIERGTPLADVLHAQAGDIRDRTRQALIEDGGRREIAMLVPAIVG